LIAWDVVLTGSFLLSIPVCPVWFLASLAKNVIQRPGWRCGLVRIAVPVVTPALVLGNNALQWRSANANANRIIDACKEFHAATGKYPGRLDQLVPEYAESVPRAKYCLMFGDFVYFGHTEDWHSVMWYVVPPFGRKIYNFETGTWHYVD
jgi:hypothetical protein